MEKPAWMICTTHMFVEVFYLTQVALIPVILREFQVSLLEASFVATVPSLVALLTYIPLGLLADRVSANRLLCLSMTIGGLSALLVSQTSNFWNLVGALSFMRIASPMYHTSGLSQITKIAKRGRLTSVIGIHNAMGNLGSGVGVITLAILLSILSWRWFYLLWAAPMIVWGVAMLASSQLKRTISEKTRSRSPNSTRIVSPVLYSALLLFLIAVSIRQVGETSISTFMTTYLVKTKNVSESIATLIFGSGAFVGIAGCLAGGHMGARLTPKDALCWAILGSVISLSILAFLSDTYSLAFMFLIYAFFSNAASSPMTSMIADVTSLTARGLGYSIYFFAESLIVSVTPVLAAVVMELFDAWVIFPLSIAFLVTGIIVLQLLRYPDRRKGAS